MRVIAGSARGRLLSAPEGLATRPTSDKVRGAVFNIIAPYVENARVLDLFAGSGAMGIEALSRGAKGAHFVDKSGSALKIVRQNLQALSFESGSTLHKSDYKEFLRGCKERFDIIFIDPPYMSDYYEAVLDEICINGIKEREGIIIVERNLQVPLPQIRGLEAVKEKKYGSTLITILK